MRAFLARIAHGRGTEASGCKMPGDVSAELFGASRAASSTAFRTVPRPQKGRTDDHRQRCAEFLRSWSALGSCQTSGGNVTAHRFLPRALCNASSQLNARVAIQCPQGHDSNVIRTFSPESFISQEYFQNTSNWMHFPQIIPELGEQMPFM